MDRDRKKTDTGYMADDSLPPVFVCPLEGASLIEASAGTGKTWNICNLYIRLLLEKEIAVPHILVLTFTVAATAELKERIRERIQVTRRCLAGVGGEPDDFLAMLRENADKQVRREHWIERLDTALLSLDEAAVFTIHGFCQKVLSTLAFSSGQVFSSTVMQDEREAGMEVVYDFWRYYVAREDALPILSACLLSDGITPDSLWDMLMLKLEKPVAQWRFPDGTRDDGEMGIAALAELFEKMRRCWESDPSPGEQVRFASSHGDLDGRTYKADKLADTVSRLAALFGKGDVTALLLEDRNVLRLFTAETLAEKTSKRGITPSSPFFHLLEEWLVARERICANLIRRFLSEVPDVWRQRKQKLRLISFGDMVRNLYQALKEDETGTLAERIRTQYHAALIDEFQDTDPLQFFIIRTIYGESGSPLFLVGDPKQSIYRFRNADLYTYLDARSFIPEARCYSLLHNQRSTDEIISACNRLFSRNSKAFMQEGLFYRTVFPGKKRPPALRDDKKDSSHFHVWKLPGRERGYMERRDARRAAGEVVANEIAGLLNNKEQIRVGDRALKASDIAILVRTHNEGGMVRQALANRHIRSVSLSQESVWHSADARELQSVLHAVLQPTHTVFTRAALATEMMGLTSADIEALAGDDVRQQLCMECFFGYRDTWMRQGIGAALRHIMTDKKWHPRGEDICTRLLLRPDGERRLTNILHMTELLSRAGGIHLQPDALLRWLQEQRDSRTTEDAQLRLESDAHLVRILTIHTAKGLEFPIVFCPYIWDMPFRHRNSGKQYAVYRDAMHKLVIDFSFREKEEASDIRSANDMEEAQDHLRLLYVALTRAVYRCYLVAGCYSRQSSLEESTKGVLNWLVAGEGEEPAAWLAGFSAKDKRTAERAIDIDTAWMKCGEDRSFSLFELPSAAESCSAARMQVLRMDNDGAGELSAAPVLPAVKAGWQMGSFSSLIRRLLPDMGGFAGSDQHGEGRAYARHENLGADYDEQASDGGEGPLSQRGEADILDFPAGVYAGNCLHAFFERADFANESAWDAAATLALRQLGSEALSYRSEKGEGERLKEMMYRMMRDVTHTVLRDTIRLKDVSCDRRLAEMPFLLSQAPSVSEALNALIRRKYPLPFITVPDTQRFLSGIIDLVFVHDGRFYILDWKSNRLGDRQADYDEQSMRQAMESHAYHLQYLIYTVALKRHLARCMADFDYETCFGGIFYLFVRGVRPAWRTAQGSPSGVYFHRPAADFIAELDALLGTADGQGEGQVV